MVERSSLDYRHVNVNSSGGFRILLISLLAALIGILAGLVAFGLYSLISFITNLVFFQRFALTLPSLKDNPLGAWIILVPVLGGLIVGVMAKYGSSKIKGHGIPEAMEAVLTNRSRIHPRVAILKPLSAAIAIGTGGPFGAEGPIIQTGGALGSLIGQLIHTTASERKVLLACGAAAGMAATFSTPIAAVILAIELLLFEFKSRSFIPLVIASTLATTIHLWLMGAGPMFSVAVVDFGIPSALPYYILLGLLCGAAAVGFSNLLYWVEDLFERIPFDSMWYPAIGALGLGILGYFFPRVIGVGYETISDILNARLALNVLLSVMIFKSLALVISLGSGTSGGLLAPMFMAGAALGGSFAMIINRIVPGANLSPAACALVGMAAVFGSAARATFTLIIFAFEITRDYNAILPLMLVCVLADGVAILLMRNSIMTEKLARRGLHIHLEYEPDVLQQTRVGEVMDAEVKTIVPAMKVRELADHVTRGDPEYIRHQAFPIVDQAHLVGIITWGDIVETLAENMNTEETVLEAGNDEPVVTYPDELLYDAVSKMLRNDIGRLPVVGRQSPHKLVGYLGRSAVMEARLGRLREEQDLEPGWVTFPKPSKILSGKRSSTPHQDQVPEKEDST
ncbi:MAG: VWA containing CoxE-like protein [Anaerolineales bacterium]|nr:CBS domain-containing protein [Anaerolineae bacterium]PWB72351.1 MAG: VWA containing CoxE-like protein [Anaerolineales bacterium]